jgi:hypothetical protein
MMIDANQRMITIMNNQGGEGRDGGRINPAIKRHLELEIKTLEIVQRDADKLRRLLEAKEREEEFWTISASPLFITTVRRKGSIMIVYGTALLV